MMQYVIQFFSSNFFIKLNISICIYSEPIILMKNKKSIPVSEKEILMLFKSYQIHPCSWDKIIDHMKANMETFTDDTKTLYDDSSNKQLRSRLSTKFGNINTTSTENITNDVIKQATCIYVLLNLFYAKSKMFIYISYIYEGVDVVEWFRALDVRLRELYCSVSMVWVQIPSREEQKFDSSKI